MDGDHQIAYTPTRECFHLRLQQSRRGCKEPSWQWMWCDTVIWLALYEVPVYTDLMLLFCSFYLSRFYNMTFGVVKLLGVDCGSTRLLIQISCLLPLVSDIWKIRVSIQHPTSRQPHANERFICNSKLLRSLKWRLHFMPNSSKLPCRNILNLRVQLNRIGWGKFKIGSGNLHYII